MDIRYGKESQKSYMIIRQEEPEEKVSFQKKMLEAVPLKKVLRIKSRIIDGETYNYYDISSQITLRQLFGSKYIDMEEIGTLCQSIQEVYDEIGKYLLDSDRIMLDPDFIFFNYAKKEYVFSYNVSTNNSEEQVSSQNLVEYLLDRVAPKDNMATDFVYTLYEYAEKVDFEVWKVIDFMLSEEMMELFGKGNDTDVVKGDYETDILDINEMSLKSDTAVAETVPDLGQSIFFDDEAPERSKRVGSVSLIILGCIGLAVCAFVYFFMVLSPSEKTGVYAGGGASVILVLIGVLLTFFGKRAEGKEKDLQKEKGFIPDERVLIDSEKEIAMAGFVSNSVLIKTKNKENGTNGEVKFVPEHTVLFETNPEECPYKLFALDKKNKQNFVLDKFPFTIGKMTGYVDGIVDHPSVSRMHARIDLKDKNLYITDLNSTNSTYLNGLKLTPNETRLLDIGDEIRFGNLNYCLRC